MGFRLESDGAKAPEWPHVICAGAADVSGRGWAWHDDVPRRPCFVGEIAAPAPLVAAAIDGRDLPGVDRLLAIMQLREESVGGILRLFRKECPACGGNHLERATRALRAAKIIHPDVIEALRVARVPESLLCEPRYLRGAHALQESKSSKWRLPVWEGDEARTRAAQLAFASRYAARHGISMSLDLPP